MRVRRSGVDHFFDDYDTATSSFMIFMIFTLLVLPLLFIAAYFYISLNYCKIEEPVRIVKKNTRKIPAVKYTNDKRQEVPDDSIQGLVEMALDRKS